MTTQAEHICKACKRTFGTNHALQQHHRDAHNGQAKKPKRRVPDVKCDYCGQPAELVNGTVLYPHRRDLADRKFWNCAPCKAYVGTHRDSPVHMPLGRLANAELRSAKNQAHAVFDPLWHRKMERDSLPQGKARNAAYKWLAGELGIDVKWCHIGMFDVDLCKRVVELCRPYLSRSNYQRSTNQQSQEN